MTASTTSQNTSPEKLGTIGRLLIDEPQVNVWALEIAPGAACDWHTHRYPYLMLAIEGDQLIAEFDRGMDPVAADVSPGKVMYSDSSIAAPFEAEIAYNRSQTRFREIVVEIKAGEGHVDYREADAFMGVTTKSGKPTSPEDPGPLGRLLFEDDRLRVWSIEIMPGESCDWHTHEFPYLMIVVEAESIVVNTAGLEAEIALPLHAGMVMTNGPTSGASYGAEIVHNRSSTPFREYLVELKIGDADFIYEEFEAFATP